MTKTELIKKTKTRIKSISNKRDIYRRKFGWDDPITDECTKLINLCEKIVRDMKTLPE